MKKIKTYNPKAFISEPGVYKFPFTPLDSTPGGSNLGRMEWHVELFKGKKKRGQPYYIEAVYVWGTQTRDERLRKLYAIKCHAEHLSGHSFTKRIQAFTDYVWRISYCRDHGVPVMSAYPEDDHKTLVIDVCSSIGIEIYFE